MYLGLSPFYSLETVSVKYYYTFLLTIPHMLRMSCQDITKPVHNVWFIKKNKKQTFPKHQVSRRELHHPESAPL